VLLAWRLALATSIWCAIFPSSCRGWTWRGVGRCTVVGLLCGSGLLVQHLGLDPRLFTWDSAYVHFEVLDYPLWWSVVMALDQRVVGAVDVRAVDAQLAILAVAFLAAAARLLAPLARPWLVGGGLLLLATSPAYFHHAQAGMADLPLAIFLALFRHRRTGNLSNINLLKG